MLDFVGFLSFLCHKIRL